MKILDGKPIPIFPLPSVVLFPQIVQPLHIFEPRYLSMVEEALDSHGFISMALLKPGYEDEYLGAPEVHPVVAVGNIITYQAKDDGTYDIVLLGNKRARIVEEVEGRPYRRGVLVELKEKLPHSSAEKEDLRLGLDALLKLATRDLEDENKGLFKLQESFSDESNVGFLVDFLAYHFIKDIEFQQTLLEELDVALRARNLLNAITTP